MKFENSPVIVPDKGRDAEKSLVEEADARRESERAKRRESWKRLRKLGMTLTLLAGGISGLWGMEQAQVAHDEQPARENPVFKAQQIKRGEGVSFEVVGRSGTGERKGQFHIKKSKDGTFLMTGSLESRTIHEKQAWDKLRQAESPTMDTVSFVLPASINIDRLADRLEGGEDPGIVVEELTSEAMRGEVVEMERGAHGIHPQVSVSFEAGSAKKKPEAEQTFYNDEGKITSRAKISFDDVEQISWRE